MWLSRTRASALTTLTFAGLLMASSSAVAESLKYPIGMFGQFSPKGLLVQRVVPDTPAHRAGVEVGDLILKVDGRTVESQDAFVSVINSSGGIVVLTLQRRGQLSQVELDLEGKKKGRGPVAPYMLGVIGSFTAQGMRITDVHPALAGGRAGLQKGDTILRIDDQVIRNQEDFFRVVYKSGGVVKLDVRKGTGQVGRVEVDMKTYNLGVVGEYTRNGMVVGIVAPDTPAAVIGLQRGDVIQRIDNQQVRSQEEFDKIINNSGGAVTLLVARRGALPTRVQVELMNNQLGAWCEPVTEGMRVTAVVPGSPAGRIGLSRGDVLLKVDRERVRTKEQLFEALQNSGGFITLVLRQAATDRVVTVEVDLWR